MYPLTWAVACVALTLLLAECCARLLAPDRRGPYRNPPPIRGSITELRRKESDHDYWAYREYLERTGFFLYLPPAQQARFVDGSLADAYTDEPLLLCQMEMTRAARASMSDRKWRDAWNASGLGSLAFLSLFGPPAQRAEWTQLLEQHRDRLRPFYTVVAREREELQRHVVQHPAFPPITTDTLDAYQASRRSAPAATG